MKPKVRDTAERNSSSVCSGPEDEFEIDFDDLDKNNEKQIPKITIKPKMSNSQFNFDETASELENIDRTVRRKSGNHSDDSSTFYSGIEDFYEKQDKLKSTYNPSLNTNLKLKLNSHGQAAFDSGNFNFDDIHEGEKYQTHFSSSTMRGTTSQFKDSLDYDENFNFDDLHEKEKYPNYFNNFNMRSSQQNIEIQNNDSTFNFDDVHDKEKYSNYFNDPNMKMKMKNSNQIDPLADLNPTFHFDDVHENEKYLEYLNNSQIKNPYQSTTDGRKIDENFIFSDIHEMEKYQNYFNNTNMQNQENNYNNMKSNNNNYENDDISEMGLDTEREQIIDSLRCVSRKPVTIYLDEASLYEGDIESETHIQMPSIRKIKSRSARVNQNTKIPSKSSFTDYLNYFGSMDDIEEIERERERRGEEQSNSALSSASKKQQYEEEFSRHFIEDDSSVFIGDIDDVDDNEKTEKDEKDMKALTINLTDKLDFLIQKKKQSTLPKMNKNKNDNNYSSFGDENSSLYEGDIESITGAEILKSDISQINKLNSSQYIENPNDLSSFFEREQFNFMAETMKKKKQTLSALGEIQEFESVDDQDISDLKTMKVSYKFV